jgi:hypothetical protein
VAGRCGPHKSKGAKLHWKSALVRLHSLLLWSKTGANKPLCQRLALWCLHVALWAACIFAIQPNSYALRLPVKARTQITLQVRTLDAVGAPKLQLQGRLSDAGGSPVAAAPLRLHTVWLGAASVDNQLLDARRAPGEAPPGHAVPARTTTDAQGQWRIEVPLSQPTTGAELHVEVSYDGDALRGPSHAETLVLMDKPVIQLALTSDASAVTTAAPMWPGRVTARLPTGPLTNATIQILVDGRTVLAVETDSSGSAEVMVPVEALGPPGQHRLEAALDASADWNAALAETQVTVFGAVRVVLESTTPCEAGDTCIAGLVSLDGPESEGTGPKAIANAAVVLHAQQRELGRLTTDDKGRFAAILRGQALLQLVAPGPTTLVAQVPPAAPFLEEGWSAPLPMLIPRPSGLAGATYGGVLLLGLTLLAGRQWWRWRSKRLAAGLQEARDAGLPDSAMEHVGAPGTPSCLLRGQVLHGESGRPVLATITLQTGDATGLQVDCGQGAFFGEFAPGNYLLLVEVDEHLPLSLPLILPHDGAWDGCVLRPASCRAVVRGQFASAVRRATGKPVDWSAETPRDIEPRWAEAIRRGHAELRGAIRQVERALYGRKTAPGDVEQVRTAVEQTEEANR